MEHPSREIERRRLARKLSKAQLARDLGVHRETLRLLLGGGGISADMALNLARVLGESPEYWLDLQTNYDLAVARSKAHDNTETV